MENERESKENMENNFYKLKPSRSPAAAAAAENISKILIFIIKLRRW